MYEGGADFVCSRLGSHPALLRRKNATEGALMAELRRFRYICQILNPYDAGIQHETSHPLDCAYRRIG